MKLGPKHQKAIHLLILDSRGPTRLNYVAEHVGVTRNTLHIWRQDDDFQREYLKQLAIYRNDFDDIKLADRKERVRALADLYDTAQVRPEDKAVLKDRNARLKMAILEQIRIEMGEGKPAEINHLHKLVGVNTPPRATNYEEWARQNQAMEVRVLQPGTPIEGAVEVVYAPTNGKGTR